MIEASDEILSHLELVRREVATAELLHEVVGERCFGSDRVEAVGVLLVIIWTGFVIGNPLEALYWAETIMSLIVLLPLGIGGTEVIEFFFQGELRVIGELRELELVVCDGACSFFLKLGGVLNVRIKVLDFAQFVFVGGVVLFKGGIGGKLLFKVRLELLRRDLQDFK